jgi:succinate dehydrogenase/fumarate reductase flavoprotein subunit
MISVRKHNRREVLAFAGAAVTGGATIAAGDSSAGAQEPAAQPAARRPTLAEVDVLVVGGGPAGIGAALGAARQGVQTLLVENHSFFGGVAAWALGMQINQVRPNGKSRSAVHELLVKKLQSYGDQAVRLGTHELWCNVEYLKVAVIDALDEVACRYLVHVRAADAIVENNRVTGVVVATKRGLVTIRAKAVVDCTGDADVSYYAGAETLTDPGTLMPMTLSLALTNIDDGKVRVADVVTALRDGRQKHPLITSGFLEIKQIAHSSSWWINHAGTADLGRLDATDPFERTKAECWSRQQALQMAQAVREATNPDVQRIEWISSGPQVSVRETRRVKGVYVITEDDAMAGRTFADTIAWRSGFLDTGGQKGGAYTKMMVHDVPYRAILPEKLDGLLVAGRCISATHMGAAAGKSMGNCMATGHAAGLAAALAAKKQTVPREIPVAEIQALLRSDGVDLEQKDRDQRGLA